MQTHQDDDHSNKKSLLKEMTDFGNQLDGLEEKAERMTAEGKNVIVGGTKTELTEYEYNRKGFVVKKLPDDEHGILRISIGGIIGKIDCNYCVIRGKHHECVQLLENALAALKNSDVQ